MTIEQRRADALNVLNSTSGLIAQQAYNGDNAGQVIVIPKINPDGSLTIVFMTVDAQGRPQRVNLSNLAGAK